MNLGRHILGISIFAAFLAAGLAVQRLVAGPGEAAPAIRVDNSPINRDPQSGNSYSPVIKKVVPCVVNIYSSRVVKQRMYRNPLMDDPLFRQFFGEGGAESGRVVTHRDNWLGCGVIVAPNGYILTANHVVDGADEIKVGVQNDRTYSAKVVGMDPPTDVAILKIEAKSLPAITLGDSDKLEVGDVVLAIGNPFGIGQTVTRGIISALGRSLSAEEEMPQYEDFIQTDAAINMGNSGGALIDAQGRLIGINDAIFSPSGTSAGIGFAVPVNLARNVLEGFLKGGRVARGYLGIELQDIDSGLAHGFGAPNSEGALVAEVDPGSPAAKAGLVSGDVIVAVNAREVASADGLRVAVSELPPGTEAKVKLYRNGAVKVIPVTLTERPDAAPSSAQPDTETVQPAKADALDGVEVQELSKRLRRQLGAQPDLAGALVTAVDRSSNSYDAGLRPGDVMLEINHQTVTNADVAVRLGKAARSEEILVKIWRPTRGGGMMRYLSVDNRRNN